MVVALCARENIGHNFCVRENIKMVNKNLYHLTLQISIKDVMLADIFCSVHGNWNVQIKVRLTIIFLVVSIFISQLNVCRRCYYFFYFLYLLLLFFLVSLLNFSGI